MSHIPFLIIGLGNPGNKYAGTRHNIGFDILDHFARSHNSYIELTKWDALYAKTHLWGEYLHLVKPMTYMNLSGKSVQRFVSFFKIKPSNIIVIHDDLDMRVGRLKLVKGGGSGGHNGIKSIVENIGTQDFFRLKVGIGRPGNSMASDKMPVERFVLTYFHQEEETVIQERLANIISGIEYFVRDSPSKSMNYLNSFK